MRLLLDSHVLLWWSERRARLPAAWAADIADPRNEVLLSAASVWEIEMKRRSGKLDLPVTLDEIATAAGIRALDITAEDAVIAGALDWAHKDPFDRMLVAQALRRGLTLVTADESMLSAPGVRFLD